MLLCSLSYPLPSNRNMLTYLVLKAYTSTNSITNGGWNPEKRCREAQAITAFLWFGFAAFLGSLIITAFNMRKTGADTRGRGRRTSQGPPPMTQV